MSKIGPDAENQVGVAHVWSSSGADATAAAGMLAMGLAGHC